MSKISVFFSLLGDRRALGKALADNIAYTYFNRLLPDKLYLKIQYRLIFGKKLNLKNPQTFNEKMQWLKLYNRKSEFSMMVDKYKVRDFIKDTIGEEYLIPLIGVWNNFDEINFDLLPNKFVLKCNHDSGSVVICKDKQKFNKSEAKRKLEKALSRDLFYFGREWPYKGIKPCILAEKYMEDEQGNELADYKVHNFNGHPRAILVCRDRFKNSGLTEDFFSETWNHLDIQRENHPNAAEREKCPEELEQILKLSEQLSKNMPFLRTDFYIINHKVFFGELTFFPASGFVPFSPDEWDLKFGEWINLSF